MIINSIGGFYNELNFLTNIPILNNHDNRDSIFNDIIGEVSFDMNGNVIQPKSKSKSNRSVVYKSKDVQGTDNIKNYYADNVNKGNDDDFNIYLKLIRNFESSGFESLRYKAADFTYLKDLGVYPINRMWTLRRFDEGVTVPDNLQDWYDIIKTTARVEPISTMVGWIKPEDDSFFGVDFNEEWTVITERLDEVMMSMMKNEFGFKGNVVSIPGFAQGLLFGFLNEMGVTKYDSNNIPMGDPNVLQEGATRAKDADPGFGLKSNIDVTLETEYEQKFIGDIDPGSAMLDIIKNLTVMGSSDVQTVFGGGGTIVDSLLKAINNPSSTSAWWDFIVVTVNAFKNAITNLFKSLKKDTNVDLETGPTTDEEGKTEKETSLDKGESSILGFLGNIETLGGSLMESILASTVAKWRWALKGSLALMTGQNSTPWHLTLGNPYSPFVSMGNIVVENIDLKFNNEFAFNDIPTNLKVVVKAKLGRNIGAQEIFQMFNNGYRRVYDNAKKSISDSQNNNIKGIEKQKLNNTSSNTKDQDS